MKLRRLNAEGVRRFGDYSNIFRSLPNSPPPVTMLTDEETSEEAAKVEVERQTFRTRFDAGSWLYSILEQTRLRDSARDKGLWSWLSLLNFDSVCPPDGNGNRKPGERARHIPDAANFQRYYRHLLAGPWRIYRTHRDDPNRARVVLCQPLHTPGDLVEQLASRQELVTNQAFMAAATQLYVDAETSRQSAAPGKNTRYRAATSRLLQSNRYNVRSLCDRSVRTPCETATRISAFSERPSGMTDIFTRKKRSAVMSRIRATGNRNTELRIIEVFRANKITGWRLGNGLFGRPDFVFSKARVAIFVDGCFWHRHPGCDSTGDAA